MTDEQWEARNGNLTREEATARGVCWQCTGTGVIYRAFAGVQRTDPCRLCKGRGRGRG